MFKLASPLTFWVLFSVSALLNSAFSHWILWFLCPLNNRNSKYLLSSSCLGNYRPWSSHPFNLPFDKRLDWLNKLTHCMFSSLHLAVLLFNIKATKKFPTLNPVAIISRWHFPCSIFQLIYLEIISVHIWNSIILGYGALLLIRKLKFFNLGFTEETLRYNY